MIGKPKDIYDLWGGLPGAIQVTRSVYDTLKDRFAFEPGGQIDVKGRSGVEAWLLKI